MEGLIFQQKCQGIFIVYPTEQNVKNNWFAHKKRQFYGTHPSVVFDMIVLITKEEELDTITGRFAMVATYYKKNTVTNIGTTIHTVIDIIDDSGSDTNDNTANIA